MPRFAFPVIPCAKEMDRTVVVHLHGYAPASYTTTVLAPYEEHRHRITRDGVLLECTKRPKHCVAASLLWWLPRLARKWIAQADKILCVSKRQAEIISDLAPELRSKMEVVYNPISPELVNGEPNKDLDDVPTFLYVGGDSYVKGYHLLLRIIKELNERKVKARLVLTNKYDHESLKLLKGLSRKCENVRIDVLGRVAHGDVVRLHKVAWALLFPSI